MNYDSDRSQIIWFVQKTVGLFVIFNNMQWLKSCISWYLLWAVPDVRDVVLSRVDGRQMRGRGCCPAEATAVSKPHHLLPHLNPDWFYLSATSLPRLSFPKGR